MPTTNAREALVKINTRWLQQALDLLEQLDQRKFTTSPAGMGPHRVGGHLRHVLEFYECFLDGLALTHIDYDSRKRDMALERSIGTASARIREIIARLHTDPELRFDGVLFVRMEDAEDLTFEDPFLMSSVARELQTLSSHTIHHFALIGMTLRAHGVAVDPDFGMAPSTIRHREQHKLTMNAEAA